MIAHIPDDVAEEIAEDIGCDNDNAEEISEALVLLWTELGNPVEMIEDVKPGVAAR